MRGKSITRIRRTAVVLLLLTALAILAGCMKKEEIDYRNDAAKDAWTERYGEEPTRVSSMECDNDMSESHRIMASMILMGNGMSDDLDSYKHIYLYMVTMPDGEERAMVLADGKYVYPS